MQSLIVEPEYTNNHGRQVEKYKNYSVKEAINYVVNQYCQQGANLQQITTQLAHLLASFDHSQAIEKANSVCVHALPTNSPLWGFLLQVKRDYEDILENKHEDFTVSLLDKAAELTGIRLANECFYDVNNPKFANPSTWFGKRIALYNPAVNFEHVCLLVHYILANPSYASADVVYPFHFFLKCYLDDPDTMKWFIYHYIKLIRVNIFSKYSQKPFAPAQLFANLRFGAITDQNIEVYGDVKLTDDKQNMLSFFSLFPRSHIVKTLPQEQPIYFAWNGLTPMITMFTSNCKQLVSNLAANSPKMPYEFFTMLNTLDITPRVSTIKNKQYAAYKTVYIDDSLLIKHIGESQTVEQQAIIKDLLAKIPEALYIEAVNFLGPLNLSLTPEEYTAYKNNVVYITYTGSEGVKTISTHHTFAQLMEAIDLRKKNDHAASKALADGCVFIPAENVLSVKHLDYIPDVNGGYSRAVRNLITNMDKTWEKYYIAANNLLPPPPVWPAYENEREQPEQLTRF